MGICASSDRLDQQVDESDENVVYVMDEQGGGGGGGDGARKVASLFSQKGKKGPNQDAVILCQGFGMEDGVLCGVFDGHGRCGQFASKLVRDYLPFMILSHRNALFLDAADGGDDLAFSDATSPSTSSSTDSSGNSSPQPPSPSAQTLGEWREACTNAFNAMDGELKLQSNMDCSFSGTTAVCAIKQGKDLIVANLGDSRAVLATMTENGYLRAVQLTADQKPSVPAEAARIRSCEGRVFGLKDEPGVMRVWLPEEDVPGLAMARSLGDFRLKRHGVIATPEVTGHRVTGADLFIVLASDGVFDVLSNEEVVSIVCATPRKQHASKAVVEAAVQRWRTKFPSSRVDDCSAVCLFLQDQSWGCAAAAAAASARKACTAAPERAQS